MVGDGSCLFRSFSFIVTGTQDQHSLVRSLICDHMLQIEEILFQYGHLSTRDYASVSDYLQKSGMRNPYEWGTQLEIYTFAYMCQTDIYVFDVETNRWTGYSKTLIVGDTDSNSQSMYIYHPRDHFDVVCSITKS